MAGLAELFLGAQNPFAQFANTNRNALGAIGAGLGSGVTFGEGLGNAAQMLPQGRTADDAYATAQKAEAERTAQLNQTMEYLRAKAPQYFEAVQAGVLTPADAYSQSIKDAMPKEPEKPLIMSQGQIALDLQTMKPLYQAPQDPKEAFGFEKDLNSQYSSTDPVKTYQVVKSGYERVRQSANADTGAGDVGLIYGFMKMLDPGSVVREGEFAVAESTTGVPQQILSLYNKAIEGTRLSPEQRQQFVALADQLYQESAANLSLVNKQYSTRAQGWNVDPSRFIVQPEVFQPYASPAITDYKSKYGLE